MTPATTFTARDGFVARDADSGHVTTAALAGQAPAGEEPRSRRLGWRIMAGGVRALITLVLLLLVGGFTAIAALPSFDARAMIVLSGSMEPLVSAGDAAIIRDVDVEDLRVGDVITYQGIGGDRQLTTHRIIAVRPLESGLHFQTQGDANATPDVNLAPAQNVVGRYDGMIPHGGRLLLLLSRPQAKLVLIALPALLILLGELRTLAAAARRRTRTHAGHGRRQVAMAGLALTLAAAVAFTTTAATMALLTDTLPVGDNTFSTATQW